MQYCELYSHYLETLPATPFSAKPQLPDPQKPTVPPLPQRNIENRRNRSEDSDRQPPNWRAHARPSAQRGATRPGLIVNESFCRRRVPPIISKSRAAASTRHGHPRPGTRACTRAAATRVTAGLIRAELIYCSSRARLASHRPCTLLRNSFVVKDGRAAVVNHPEIRRGGR